MKITVVIITYVLININYLQLDLNFNTSQSIHQSKFSLQYYIGKFCHLQSYVMWLQDTPYSINSLEPVTTLEILYLENFTMVNKYVFPTCLVTHYTQLVIKFSDLNGLQSCTPHNIVWNKHLPRLFLYIHPFISNMWHSE